MKDKTHIRQKILAARTRMSNEEKSKASARIVEKLIQHSLFEESQVIFTFVPFGHEVDIRPFLFEAEKKGKEVLIPRTHTEQRRMQLFRFQGGDDLISGANGIPEPNATKEEWTNLKDIDTILVPGVAFDRNGGRIGYGGGYYDRFFVRDSPHARRVAPCFSCQVVSDVPTEPHDIRVHELITEDEHVKIE